MCVWLLLCTDPLVYSGERDEFSVTLVTHYDIHLPFQYGKTALMKASELGRLEFVKMLLDRGADVNMQDTVSAV